ncbi:MAG: ParB/RepB/Spo0J family partition protein [Bacilli bacterium]
MKKDKLLSTSLAKLIEKYSQSDVIFAMEREAKLTPLLQIPVAEISDNHYLSSYMPPEAKIARLVEVFQTASNIEPIIIRKHQSGYEVVIGRKRLLAAKIAGIKTISALIREFTDEETLLALLANAREEQQTSPIEIAMIAKALIENFDYSQKDVAALLHLSRAQVTNILRLLSLPSSVIANLNAGKISYGHARALITLPESEIIAVNEQIKKRKLNVRETENLVSIYKGKKPDTRLQKFEEKYRAELQIRGKKIEINFTNHEDLITFYEWLLRE